MMQLIKRDARKAAPEPSVNALPQSAPSRAAAAPIGAPTAQTTSTAPSAGQNVAKQPTPKSDFRDQQRANPASMREISAENGHSEPREKEMVGGIDADVYSKLVKELGRPAPRRKRINVQLAEKMHRLGWTHKQIARHFNCSPCTIRRRLEEAKKQRMNKVG